MHNGGDAIPALLKRTLQPTGWPEPVEVRELTAGDILDIHQLAESERDRQVQYHVLVACTFDTSGQRLFDSVAAVRALPARLLKGLLEVMRVCAELNSVPEPADGGQANPTSDLSANSSSA